MKRLLLLPLLLLFGCIPPGQPTTDQLADALNKDIDEVVTLLKGFTSKAKQARNPCLDHEKRVAAMEMLVTKLMAQSELMDRMNKLESSLLARSTANQTSSTILRLRRRCD